MTRHERLTALLRLVHERENVHVDDLVDALGVSPATVRRDLDALAEQQLITRTRGGATTTPVSSDLPLRYKAARHADEKSRIARAAAALVVPGAAVGLNGGTTATEVAREIALLPTLQDPSPEAHVVLVTNAVNIANEMTVRPHVRVVVTGGAARTHSYELVGPLATLILAQVTIDVLFLGVDALDATVGASTHHESEAAVNAALVEAADRVVVVADSSKLGRRAFARICDPGRIERVITDAGASPEQVAALEAAGIAVQVV